MDEDFQEPNFNENDEFYDPHEENAREEWGEVFDTMMVCFGSDVDDVKKHIREATDAELGMPIKNKRMNVVRLLIERIIHDGDDPNLFEVVLEKYPEIVVPKHKNPLSHTLGSILASIVEDEVDGNPLYYPMYEHQPVNMTYFKRFLDFLKNRDPSINPGYEFFKAVHQKKQRELLQYLVVSQHEFLLACIEYGAFQRRKHALTAAIRTRRRSRRGRGRKTRRRRN